VVLGLGPNFLARILLHFQNAEGSLSLSYGSHDRPQPSSPLQSSILFRGMETVISRSHKAANSFLIPPSDQTLANKSDGHFEFILNYETFVITRLPSGVLLFDTGGFLIVLSGGGDFYAVTVIGCHSITRCSPLCH
jgi:hypothetical protein